MKPKSYRQLKMTEIVKQKKTNKMPVASTPKKKATNSGSMTEYLHLVYDEVTSPIENAAANDDYSDDEKVTELEAIIQRVCNKCVSTFMKGPEGMGVAIAKLVYEEITNIMFKMDELYQEKFNSIETELRTLRDNIRSEIDNWRVGLQEHIVEVGTRATDTVKRVDDLEKVTAAYQESSSLNDTKIEGKFGVLNVKIDLMEEKILELNKEVQILKSKPEIDQREDVGDQSESHGGVVGGITNEDAEKLRILHNNYEREQASYWSRSLRISNFGIVDCSGSSKYSSIKKLLDKYGIGSLISHAESFFVHSSNREVRVTFKTVLDMQHFCSIARRTLKELNNRTVAIHTLVSPKFVDKKRELLKMGRIMKSQGVIVRYEVVEYKAKPMLKTWSVQYGVKWYDVGDFFNCSVEGGTK